MKVFALVCLPAFTLGGWFVINPGYDFSFGDLCFPSGPDTGFCVTWPSTALKTTDAGVTWSRIRPGEDVRQLQFLDNSTGYVSSFQDPLGTVHKSTDGGTTWSVCTTGVRGVPEAMHFASCDIGYVWLEDLDHHDFVLSRTTDGGRNWSIKPGFPYVRTAFFLADGQTGYALSDLVLKTTDGGETWDTLAVTGRAVQFPVDAQTGYLVGGERILKTTDGGETWVRRESGLPTYRSLVDVDFPTGNDTGWVSGERGLIAMTTDGGMSWTDQTYPIWQRTYVEFPVDTRTGYAGAVALLKTTDGGTWIGEECERGVAGSCIRLPTVMSGPELARLSGRLRDALGRDVTDRRHALSPGIYFVSTDDSRHKLVLAR